LRDPSEIHIAFELLGAEPELLGIFGRWSVPYDNDQTLRELRDFNCKGAAGDVADIDLSSGNANGASDA
jgi:hypothetical protein